MEYPPIRPFKKKNKATDLKHLAYVVCSEVFKHPYNSQIYHFQRPCLIPLRKNFTYIHVDPSHITQFFEICDTLNDAVGLQITLVSAFLAGLKHECKLLFIRNMLVHILP